MKINLSSYTVNKIAVCVAVIFLFLSIGCDGFQKKFVEGTTINLPQNKKFVTCGFNKDNGFFYVTREMKSDEDAETYNLHSESNFSDNHNVNITISEHKTDKDEQDQIQISKKEYNLILDNKRKNEEGLEKK